VKQTYLSIAAAAAISITGVTAGFAGELPTYETQGMPISTVQLRALGAANVREQAPTPTSTLTPVQLSVLTPRAKITTAVAASARGAQ